jgi:hypothetical protein
MSLLSALLTDPAPFGVWVASRTDNVLGTGTARDPLNGSTRRGPTLPITLAQTGREAQATVHGASLFAEGDLVTIEGVTGDEPFLWNGTFGIYGVSGNSFKYLMKKAPQFPIGGSPTAIRLTFPFDEIMREIP